MIYYAKLVSSYQFFLFEKEQDAIQKCINLASNYITFVYNNDNRFFTITNLIFAKEYIAAIKYYNQICAPSAMVAFGTTEDVLSSIEPFKFSEEFLIELNIYNKTQVFK